jgi:hypothetical protein
LIGNKHRESRRGNRGSGTASCNLNRVVESVCVREGEWKRQWQREDTERETKERLQMEREI